MKKHSITLSYFTTDINKGATKDDITNSIPKYKSHRIACDCKKCVEKKATNPDFFKTDNWGTANVTKKELAEKLITGYYLTPVKLEEKNHYKESFISSDVIAFDFDNGDKPEDVLKAFKEIGINIAIAYTSASDKPEKRKFRMITFLSDSFHSAEHYEEALHGIYVELKDRFGIKPDFRTLNATHTFYPGKELILLDEEAETPFATVSKLRKRVQPIKHMIRMENRKEKEEAEKKQAKEMGVTVEEMYRIQGEEKKAERAKKKAEREQLIKEGKLDRATARSIERADFNELVEALKAKDIEKCKAIMAPKYKQFDRTQWSMMTMEQREEAVPFTELFDIDLNEKFLCWLPEHESDTKPSSEIKISRGGQQLYTCFGCGNYRQLHTVLGLLTGLNTRETARFLTTVTGLEWLSNYQIETVLRVKDLERTIYNQDFPEMYPELHKFAKSTLLPLYLFMIGQASLLVLESPLTKKETDITFFMSTAELSRRAKVDGMRGVKCPKELNRRIKNLCVLGLLKTEKDGLREDVQDKANLLRIQKQYKREQNFYTVNTSPNAFIEAEAMAIRLKELGYRKGQTSQIQMDILLGKEFTEGVYKQDKVEDLDYKQDEVKFLSLASFIVAVQGYASKSDIVEEYMEKDNEKRSRKSVERRFEKIRGTFDKAEYFQPILVTKATREQYRMLSDVRNRTTVYVGL